MKNHLKIIFILTWFILYHQAVQAQPGEVPVKKIKDREYYVHTVKKGETLSGISKKYKVSLAVVMNENSSVGDKIKPGDEILIPVTDKNRLKTPAHTGNNVERDTLAANAKTHTVEKGETVYGIARRYGITQEELIRLNPAASQGISPGDVLVLSVPVVYHSRQKKVQVEYTVRTSETFFSISRKFIISQDSIRLLNNGLPDGLKAGMKLMLYTPESRWEEISANDSSVGQTQVTNALNTTTEPVVIMLDKENLPQPVFKTEKKDSYRVGLILPFCFDKNEKFMLENENRDRALLYEPTRQSVDFYQGVRLAMDSLQHMGLRVTLQVFDMAQDSLKLRAICESSDFRGLDLIIGPTDYLELAGRYARAQHIPLVCPVPYSNRILLDNPYIFKMIGSASVMADKASAFVYKKYPAANVMMIDTRGESDKGMVKAYVKYLNRYKLQQAPGSDSVRVIKMDYFKTETIKTLLSYDKKNIIIIPSNDVAYVSVALSNLNKFMVHARNMHKEYDIMVLGTEEWIKMEDVDISHKIRTQVHVPSPTQVDYDTAATAILVKSFRHAFKTDPDKYALMGFDIAYFWMSGYLQYGTDFNNHVTQYEMDLVQTGMRFMRLNENSGFLNENVYILKYDNFRLVPQNE